VVILVRDNEARPTTPPAARRVLLIGDYPPPYGGVSAQVAALQRRLAALPDTTVSVLDIGVRRAENRPGCLSVCGAGDFAAKLTAHAARGFTLHGHTNGHNAKSWLIAAGCAAAGLANGRRTVISLGSGLMPQYLAQAGRGMRALVRASVRTAGALIVRNERSRTALLSTGARPEQVRILPGFYGVSSAEIGPVPSAADRFVRRHHPVIGSLASYGPEYGLALLIDAAARLRPRHPELGVLLVGPAQPPGGAPPWVISMGELERASLLAVMRSLDVFVRPTYFDGDASSVREALALGVRVVASDTDYRPAGVALFPRGDADALAEAIETALKTPAEKADSTSLPALLDLYDALPLAAAPRRPRIVAATAPGEDRRVA
jgi:glycogen(starch) synthase